MFFQQNRNLLFIILFYFLTPLNCDAQLQKGYYFHNYDEKNGLIAKYNTFFFTDSKGFLWISSTEGLNRFDGLKVKTYLHNPSDSTSLYDNNIQSPFFEDRKGNLWFCTAEAIHCYNRQKDNFNRFWIVENGKQLESDYYLFALDGKDILWFRSGSWDANPKLYKLDINKIENSILPAQFVCDFAGYRSKILSQYEQKTAILTYPSTSGYGFVEYEIDKTGRTKPTKTYLSGENFDKFKIKSIVSDKNNIIWLATDKGLVSYDKKNGQFQLFDSYKDETIDNVLGLATWKEDKLIISTRNAGVLFYDKNHKIFYEQLKNEELKGLVEGLCSSVFETIYVDSTNNLWLSSAQNSCLNHINLDKIKFSNVQLSKFFLKNFSRILCDDLNNIWVSYEGIGILVFNNKGEIVKSFDEKQFFDKKIRHFLKDKEGRIWIQTDHQLLKSENGAYTLQTVYISQDTYLYNLQQLNDGRLILLTEKGIFQLIGKQLKPFQELPSTYQSLRFRGIFQDNKDNLFLAELGSTIKVFDFKQDSVLKTELQIKDNINEFFQQNDTIWVTGGKGLWKIYESPNKSFQYNFVLNLPFLYKIFIDKSGIFWLISDSGLYTFNPQNRQLHKYNASDGLKGNIFSRFCALLNGDIWIAAYNNINVFNPNKIKLYTNPPKIQITDIKVNDAVYTEGGNVSELNKITLPYTRNTITFQFVAIEFADPEYNKLKFRLDNYDEDGIWNEVFNKEGYIKYFKLPFGTYTLRIKAANADGVWSPDEKTFIIHINAPWYLTWWGILLEVLTVLAIGWAILQWRLKIQRDKAAIQQKILKTEMQALRAQMDPHFLYNAMNSINSFIISNDARKASTYLTDFARLVRKILDFSKEESISIEKEAEILREYLNIEAMRFNHKFDYSVTIDPDLDEWDTQIPTMILQPFVENAILHGVSPKTNGQGHIQVRFEKQGHDFMRCVVEDNGIGRKKSAQLSKGAKLKEHESKGMQITADRIDILNLQKKKLAKLEIIDLFDETQQPTGTRIVLHIPLLMNDEL